MHNYELYLMKNNEIIVEMFTRFTNITNWLQALGKSIHRTKESDKDIKVHSQVMTSQSHANSRGKGPYQNSY